MKSIVREAFLEGAQLRQQCADSLSDSIERAADILVAAHRAGGKSIIFGNGGSAADAQHYAAELVGRFIRERAAMPAIALTCNTSTLTAVGNDYGYDMVFARQIEAFTQPGDAVIAISTSGNSPNILKAMERARELGARVIGLTGRDGGGMPERSDVCVVVPHKMTARIQEIHITVIHCWCDIIERECSDSQK